MAFRYRFLIRCGVACARTSLERIVGRIKTTIQHPRTVLWLQPRSLPIDQTKAWYYEDSASRCTTAPGFGSRRTRWRTVRPQRTAEHRILRAREYLYNVTLFRPAQRKFHPALIFKLQTNNLSVKMVTYYLAYTAPINPPNTTPVLTVPQVWQGLQRKIRFAQEFVSAITSCTVLEDKDGVVTRKVTFKEGMGIATNVREVVKSYEPTWVSLTSLSFLQDVNLGASPEIDVFVCMMVLGG